MRLTADVLLHAENYLNAYQDREINLRGMKIPAVENLSVLQDQYDVIDLSDNDIKRLDNFPHMARLNALIVNNNSLVRVAPRIGDYLGQLEVLILTNNKISHLYEIDNIATLKRLSTLSLMENPVTFQAHYRAYVIYKLPQLKALDFNKISKTERDQCAHFFNTSAGKAFLSTVQQQRAVFLSSVEQKQSAGQSTASNSNNGGGATTKTALSLTDDQRRQVREAIEKATTKDEIDLIEYQLRTGSFEFTVPQPVTVAASSSTETSASVTAPAVTGATPKKPEATYDDMDVID